MRNRPLKNVHPTSATDASELTTNEYYEWLQAEELKKEAAKAKQRKAEENQR